MAFSIEVHDFDLEATLFCGQCFAFWEVGDGSFSGIALGRHITLRQDGDSLHIDGISEEEFERDYRHYLGLEEDYEAYKEMLSEDPILKKAISFSPGIRVMHQPLWETVCSFIISQNNNIKRITGIVERLREGYGRDMGSYRAFPEPEALANLTAEDLAPLRSGYRAKFIIDAAKKFADGSIDEELVRTAPLGDARAHLMQINGVGPKVADCVLLFAGERMEAFPMDVWIKRVMATLYPDGFPEFAKPIAGIAQQYLFHYARLSDQFK